MNHSEYLTEYDYLVKVILVGDSGVGKSCLLNRFVNRVGEFCVETVLLECGKAAKIDIWDVSGKGRFQEVVTSYYRGTHCAVLVYDVTRVESLRRCANYWAHEVTRLSGTSKPVILLFGNKCDLEDEATREEAARISENRGWTHLTTSAKNGLNVEKAFRSAAERVIVHWGDTGRLQKGLLPVLVAPTRVKVKNGCCAII